MENHFCIVEQAYAPGRQDPMIPGCIASACVEFHLNQLFLTLLNLPNRIRLSAHVVERADILPLLLFYANHIFDLFEYRGADIQCEICIVVVPLGPPAVGPRILRRLLARVGQSE